MPKKLTQAEIEKMSDDWAKKCLKIADLETKRNAEIHPHQVAFEKKTAGILESYDPQIEKLQEQANAIETQVLGWVREQKKALTLDGRKWQLGKSFGTSIGARVADVKAFLAFAKTKGDAVYECLTVVLKKAEPLIGKKDLDAICTKPVSPTTDVWLRLKD